MISVVAIAVCAELSVDALLLAGRQAGVASFPEVLAVMPTVFYPDEHAAIDAAVLSSLAGTGVLDESGSFNSSVLHWVSILGRPHVEAAARVRNGSRWLRMSLVRAGETHVLAARLGEMITVQPVFCDGTDPHVVTAALWSGLGACPALSFAPVTALTADLAALQHLEPGELIDPLLGLGAEGSSAAVISTLGHARQRAEITMTSYASTGARSLGVGIGVFDTEHGRVIARARRGANGQMWSVFVPGSLAEFHQGVTDLAALLPEGDWFGAAHANSGS
ncbi:ESX secretion-associated protein EspG [Nocardia brasiliensis]|uniref:ESX secretion-associated protein EspG n=1 Tax=Nocardia brasiliensis TaxID=37326 RepID=UPI00245672D7|nr:ESX secretion-associated protein EspG [Nocardia brasiliensis]